MTNFSDLASFQEIWSRLQTYFFQDVLSWGMAIQVAVVAGAIVLAHQATRGLKAWFNRLKEQSTLLPEWRERVPHLTVFLRVIHAFLAFIVIWVAHGLAGHYQWPREGLFAAGVIALALALVRLITGAMTDRFWARLLAGYIWLFAALYILHLVEPWQNLLNNISFSLGQARVTLLHITRSLPFLLVLYWLSTNLSLIWRFWLKVGSGLTPAVQILLSRLGSIFLFSASVVLVLHYLNLDLTVFALFSGALGLGLGFGLQKVFANLVSGFILLADKSIKPGDVIQLKDTYGWINFLGSRYISVITRSGTEHLIPNENLITSEVINWSYSQNLVRLKVPVGVAYGSDIEKARDLMLQVAGDTPRVLKDPKPSCYLLSFGDNAVNLELRVWINDPQNGLGSVKSNLHWGIWHRFKEHDIDMPFPQREVHLKTVPEIKVTTGPEEK